MITLKQQSLCRNYYTSTPDKTPMHYQTQFRLYGLSAWDALRMLVELEIKEGNKYIRTHMERDASVTQEGSTRDVASMIEAIKRCNARVTELRNKRVEH